MSKKIELIKNTIILMVGKILTQLISFLLLPFYTSYLLTSEYGMVDLIVTYANLLAPLLVLQIEQATFRYLIDAKDDSEKTKIISSGFRIVLITTIIYSAIYLILSFLVNIPFTWITYGLITSNILLSCALQILRGLNKNIMYAIGSTLVASITIITSILFIVTLNMGATGMLLSMVIANLSGVVYILIVSKLYKYINYKKSDKKLTKEMLAYSLPLIPNSLSWWVINVSDRTIITAFLGLTANGIYAISNKFSSIINMFLGVFSLSWTQSIAKYIDSEDRDKYLSETFNSVIKIFMSLLLLLLSSMPIIFPILIDKSYNDAYLYIPILLVATLFNIVITLYSGVYVAKKMTKKVASTSIMAAIINILINLIFIKYIGIYAAAISTMVSYGVLMIYRYVDMKKLIHIKYDYKSIGLFTIFITIATFFYYFNNIYISLLSIVISSVISCIYNKDILNILYKRIIKK